MLHTSDSSTTWGRLAHALQSLPFQYPRRGGRRGRFGGTPSGRSPATIEWVDVLGGAATLIVTPAGEWILVDTGWPGFDSRDAKRIKAALDKHGLTAIDHLVITHYHANHYGGVPQLAALVPIEHVYDHGPMTALPEDRNFAQMYGAYRAAAKDTTTTLKAGDTIALKQGTGPKLTLTVVAASGRWPAAPPRRPTRRALQR